MKRLEQVDVAALKAPVAGHSKCPTAFYFLEYGTLMVRHKVMIKRLMYHHHILSREDDELVKKVYDKQKEDTTRGDWIETLREDFEIIGVIMDKNLLNAPQNTNIKSS